MTERPPWYGGNKIPASYLKRFMPSQGKRVALPEELSRFLDQMGDEKHG